MSGTKCVSKGKIMHHASGDKGPSRDIRGKFVANKFKLMSSEGQTSYFQKA